MNDHKTIISAYVDDELTEDQHHELVAWMRRSPSNVEDFIVECCLHSQLRDIFREERIAHDVTALQMSDIEPNSTPCTVMPSTCQASHLGFPSGIHGTAGYFSSGWPVAYLVATVIFAVGLLVGAVTHVSHPAQIVQQSPGNAKAPSASDSQSRVVGRITGMVDCRWDGAAVTKLKSLVALSDKFILASGLMEITYDSGAKVILQGPVTYEVESAAGGYLSVGKLTAKLEKRSAVSGQQSEISNPQSPIPNPSLPSVPCPLFSVRTPTAVVTDLGTEFGVEVSEKGTTQVHVLQGLVEARRVGRQADVVSMERLREGMAVEIGREKKQIETVKFAPQTFTRKLHETVSTSAETAYMKAVLADKPLGYWPLNEPSGSRKFLDRSGNGIHGYAMRELTAGVPGPLSDGSRAVAFDGKGYIDFGSRDQFALKNDITIEAWVWIGEVQPSSHVVSILGRGGDGYIGWGLFAGRRKDVAVKNAANPIVPYLIGYDVQRFPFSLSAGESIENRWLHLAAAFDTSNTAHLYLNGKHRGSLAAGKPGSVGPVWLQIGGAELIDEDFWQGRIAQVAIYPHALGAEQIWNHYSQHAHREREEPDKQ